MEDQFDLEAFAFRARQVAKEIRKSEAYPAILGALAGGIAGAMIAAIIAGRGSPRRAETTLAAKESKAGWNAKDLAQLVAVAAPLAKQIQAYYSAQRKK
jgi:hypothetical protein